MMNRNMFYYYEIQLIGFGVHGIFGFTMNIKMRRMRNIRIGHRHHTNVSEFIKKPSFVHRESPHHSVLIFLMLPTTVPLPSTDRSPELFHEYLLAGDRLLAMKSLLKDFRDMKRIQMEISVMVSKQKPNNFLAIKSEDMNPNNLDSSQFLDRLATFLDVSKDDFDDEVLHSFRNCGDHKGGSKTHCESKSSGYAITGGREMLKESRELVYLYFAEECKLWAEEFGIVYKDCLDVRERYIIGSNQSSSSDIVH